MTGKIFLQSLSSVARQVLSTITKKHVIKHRALIKIIKVGAAVNNLSKKILCPKCSKIIQRSNYRVSSKLYGTWEPDGLNPPPEIPEYDVLHIQMKGYDYPILESYSKYVHNLTDSLGLESDSYPVPARSFNIELFYPNSANKEHTYDLQKYERIVQIEYVPSTILPLVIEALRLNSPAGVEVTIKKPDPDEEENRYIPDKELLELKEKIQQVDQKKSDIRSGRF